ncbi:arabinose transporter [Celerinatantimonas sp. MCCC 1A17872]|uniref:arabinose transporter n=1 Tax=Celerinatantimonas sp. MCCC 1A17872 TaxID=3177514 RepID=UPI0038CA48F7
MVVEMRNDTVRLAWLTASLFIAYLAVATALPVIPIYVSHGLHFSNSLGGLAVGISFLSTILTRGYAGKFADTYGAKKCVWRGFACYGVASLLCLVSTWHGLHPWVAYALLIVGRLLLGLGESQALVGINLWGIGLLGPSHSGRVMAWVGAGMYGAFAVGSVLGVGVYQHTGIVVVMTLGVILPLIGWLISIPIPAAKPTRSKSNAQPPFVKIVGQVFKPGAVVCLQGIGFAVIGAFCSLYFMQQHWGYAGTGLTFFGCGFVISRLLFGSLPDRIGGIKVALLSIIVEAIGQYMLWLAPNLYFGLAGALLTGLGCSMIFPSMGIVVVKEIPAHIRGSALGAFSAFQDLAYGISAPITGIVADHYGYGSVFAIGGVAATVGVVLIIRMALVRRQQEVSQSA